MQPNSMSLAERNRQGTKGLKGTKKEIKGKWSRMEKEKIYIHTQARKLSEKLKKKKKERERCSTEYVASIRDKLILSHFDL